MADDLSVMLETQLPALFARTVAELERRAPADRAAAQLLAGLEQPTVALLRLAAPDARDLWLRVARSGVAPCAAPAADAFGHALALPASAARHALAWLTGGAPLESLLHAFVGLCSADARDLFAAARYAFELEVTRVPVLGDVRLQLALGRPKLAATPEFVLRLDFDELEDARERGAGPEELFMAGQIAIDGDVAKAMMLGMTLAQLR